MEAGKFHELCNELAPTWAEIPGLISKVWLENSESNTYGGIYTWESRDAMTDFLASELFNAIATHPNFTNASATDFGVIAEPTRVTRGLAAIPV
jgi:hypothetical protein